MFAAIRRASTRRHTLKRPALRRGRCRLAIAGILLASTAATNESAGWTTVCSEPGIQFHQIAVEDGSGGALVAWHDAWAGTAGVQRLTPLDSVHPGWPTGGVTVAGGVAGGLAVCPDGEGGALVVWMSGVYDLYAQHVLASGAVDPAWPAGGAVVAVAPNNQIEPRMVPDGAGGAIVTWYDSRSGSWDVYAQRILATGAADAAWPANGLLVCGLSGSQEYPDIVSDGAGGAFVAWRDRRGSSPDIYAHHVLGSGALDPAWPSSGVALCDAAGSQGAPLVVSDDAGGAIAAWSDTRNGDVDVFAMRVLSTGAPAPGWADDGEALCEADLDQKLTDLAADGDGGAVAVWWDKRTGGADIYAGRITEDGSIPWLAGGVPICVAVRDQIYPHLAMDGDGGAFIAWQDRRDPGQDPTPVNLFVHRLLMSGSVDPAWPVDGMRITTEGLMGDGPGYEPAIVGDGVGGAMVAWTWPISPNGFDILSAHLTSPDPPNLLGVAAPSHAPSLTVFPNPSRGLPRVSLTFRSETSARVTVRDVQGRWIRTLLDERVPAGPRWIEWDRNDHRGRAVPDGVYVVTLEADGRAFTRRIVATR